MESVIYGGEKVRIQRCKKFLRKGFYIEADKVLFEDMEKPLYIFSLYIDEDYYMGTAEFNASTLKSAIKKLDNWIIHNYPEMVESNILYQYDTDRYNDYKIKQSYIKRIIRDNPEDY